MTYDAAMYSIIETPTFKSDADRWWTEDERLEFITWLAANPDAGEVIRGSGGCRKLRWVRRGRGKRGGFRVIYFTQLQDGLIWLLMMYAKTERSNIPPHILNAIRTEIER